MLEACLSGRPWSRRALVRLVDEALSEDEERARDATSALFRTLVEPLGDLFEPSLADVYADLFSDVCARVLPDLDAAHLYARYRRVRRPRRFRGADPRTVFVLSRVTLGADVAVTSVMLNAARRRFGSAEIVLVGPRKNYELFAADPRIRYAEFSYGRRGLLRERLALWMDLRALLDRPDSIVIDPDSRLTQLGLLPVCPEDRYYFFESRSYGGDGSDPLARLASRWAALTFDVATASPYVQPEPVSDQADITVSFGVGENQDKRLPDPFESELLRALLAKGGIVLVDKGAGGEETERVEHAIRAAGDTSGRLRAWQGAFAPFAARIARSRLYAGYDSAGQHVAAACGVPLVTVFAGFASSRTLARWRPCGPGAIEVVSVDGAPDPREVLERTLEAVGRLM